MRIEGKAVNGTQPKADHKIPTDATDLVLSVPEVKAKGAVRLAHSDHRVPRRAFGTEDAVLLWLWGMWAVLSFLS